MIYDMQLEWMTRLHTLRSEGLDVFFTLLNYFDSFGFYAVLVIGVWLLYGRRVGVQCLLMALLCKGVNGGLKEFFHSPRPFHMLPDLMVVEVKGFGFPSGAAQGAVMMVGIVGSLWKGAWKWFVLGAYALLISFSRIYLGVHFPMDIAAGWIVGGGLVAVYRYVLPWAERKLGYGI